MVKDGLVSVAHKLWRWLVSPKALDGEASVRGWVLSGAMWALAGRGGRALIVMGTNALLARMLSPEEMGVYFLVLSILGTGTLLAQIGLGKAVVRLIGEAAGTGRAGRARGVICSALAVSGVSTAAVTLLYLAFGRTAALRVFQSRLLAGATTIVGLLILVQTFQGLAAEAFRGFGDILMAAVFGDVTGKMLELLVLAAFWFSRRGIVLREALMVVLVTAGCVVALEGWLLVKRIQGISEPEPVAMPRVLQTALPLFIVNLIFSVLPQANLWVLARFGPAEQLAVYGAAADIASFVAMPILIVNSVVPPLIARMYEEGRTRELEKVLRTTATVAGLPAFVVLMGFMLRGGAILSALYGEYYRIGGPVLALLSVPQLVDVWVGSCGQTLMMTGHQRTMLVATLVPALLTILASAALVHGYGMVGVAAAVSVGLALRNSLMWLGARRKTGMWTHMQPLLLCGNREGGRRC